MSDMEQTVKFLEDSFSTLRRRGYDNLMARINQTRAEQGPVAEELTMTSPTATGAHDILASFTQERYDQFVANVKARRRRS